MLGDYFTKPPMGKMFKELWGVFMGYKSILDLDPTILSPIKGRVVNNLRSSD